MSAREPHLPDFAEPPVIETVLGVNFSPISAWKIPHYGLFWTEIKAEYPRIDVQPPFVPQTEKFGAEERVQTPPSIEFVSEPYVRCWFLAADGGTLIQLQRDAFLHNWRKTGRNEPYPHYDKTRPVFERDWWRFIAFLKKVEIDPPAVSQCELTYVNHIERGQLWNDFSDLPSIFPLWGGTRSESFLPRPDGAGFSIRFQMPSEQGRLHVSMQPGIRQTDGKDVLEFKLTARGGPASSQTEDIIKWLDLGREWIVRGFTDLTSERAHKFWKRTQ